MNNINNVLIIGSARNGSLESAYRHAFRVAGCSSVDIFDVEQSIAFLHNNRILNRLSQNIQVALVGNRLFRFLDINGNKYDLVVVFKGMLLCHRTIARGKSLTPGAYWLNINPDDPFDQSSRGATNQKVKDSIPLFDAYVTWHRNIIPKLTIAGAKLVFHVPFAYNSLEHYPSEELDSALAQKISFVGCWDKERESILTGLSDYPLAIFGDFWDRVANKSPLRDKIYPGNVYGAALRRIITSSKASINILRPQNYGSHNMRTFEIPAMGGLMITTFSEEQDTFFPNGRASLMYRNMTELKNIVRAVVDGSVEMLPIKECARKLIVGQSYLERADYLLGELNRSLFRIE